VACETIYINFLRSVYVFSPKSKKHYFLLFELLYTFSRKPLIANGTFIRHRSVCDVQRRCSCSYHMWRYTHGVMPSATIGTVTHRSLDVRRFLAAMARRSYVGSSAVRRYCGGSMSRLHRTMLSTKGTSGSRESWSASRT